MMKKIPYTIDQTGYLTELLHGNYKRLSEDRLTQIFSATFNHSSIFKKAVGDFFGFPTRNCISSTQESFKIPGKPLRLDILIKSSKKVPRAIIENKIEAQLTNYQLSKYDEVKSLRQCKKCCLVKDYYNKPSIKHNWQVEYWSEFYNHLLSISHRKIDFFTSNFIELLKEYNMEKPDIIRKKDLKELVKALYEIRFEDKPQLLYKGPVFETLLAIKLFLEDVLKQAAQDKNLIKRTGKAFLRPTLKLNYWWDTDKTERKKRLQFGCQARLIKPYKKIVIIGVAFQCYGEGEKDRYDMVAYVSGAGGIFQEPDFTFPKKDIKYSEFAEGAIKYWCNKLK